MATATAPVADRLSFAWVPSADPAFAWLVRISERRPRSTRHTDYLVDVVEPAAVEGVVYLFAKHPDHAGERSDDVYETMVGPGGTGWCSCAGTVCWAGAITCRHRLAVEHLIQQQAGEIL